jgi:hypothetical protein
MGDPWAVDGSGRDSSEGRQQRGRLLVFSVRMACSHTGFHAISTAYDRRDGVLVYHWTCEHCGARLSEAARAPYRPSYDPRGNERVQTVLQARAVGG